MDHSLSNEVDFNSNDEEYIKSWSKGSAIDYENDFLLLLKSENRNPDKILNPNLADLVSFISKSSRISLRFLSILAVSLFEYISINSEHQKKSIYAGADMLKNKSSSLLGDSDMFGIFSLANFFVSKPIELIESTVQNSFHIYRKSVELGFFLAEENIRLLEVMFGNTETSAVLKEFIKLVKREGWDKNPEVQLILKNNGLFNSLLIVSKTLVAWIILQLVTRSVPNARKLQQVYANFGIDKPFCPRNYKSISCNRIKSKSFSQLNQHPGLFDSINRSKLLNSKNSLPTITIPNEEDFYKSIIIAKSLSQPPTSSIPFDENSTSSNTQNIPSSPENDWYDQITNALNSLNFKLANSNNDDFDLNTSPNTNNFHLNTITKNSSPIKSAPISKNNSFLFKNSSFSPSNRTLSLNIINPAKVYPKERRHSFLLSDSDSFPDSDLFTDRKDDLLNQNNEKIDFIDFENSSIYHFQTESAPPSLPSSPKLNPSLSIDHFADTNIEVPDVKSCFLSDYSIKCDSPEISCRPPEPTPILDQKSSKIHIDESDDGHIYSIYPNKPLLFNIARFATFAMSAYGAKFLSVMGLDGSHIDIKSLLDKYGDNPISSHLMSYTISSDKDSLFEKTLSCSPNPANSTSIFDEASSQSDSISITPRAVSKPESFNSSSLDNSFTTDIKFENSSSFSNKNNILSNSPYKINPLSSLQRDSKLSNLNSVKLGSGSIHNDSFNNTTKSFTKNRSATSYSYRLKKTSKKALKVNDHPNHLAFCKHTGINISDLLFSSYISPFSNDSSSKKSKKNNISDHNPKLHKRNTGASGTDSESYPKHPDNFQIPGYGLFKSLVYAPLNVAKSSINFATSIFSKESSPEVKYSISSKEIKNKGSQLRFKSKHSNSSDLLDESDTSGTYSSHFKKSKKNSRKQSLHKKRYTKNEPSKNVYYSNTQLYREPSIHAPVHYIAVDHYTKSVVLAIRGTLGVSDLFVDMMCTYKRIILSNHPISKETEFKVHSGMWQSAIMLANPSGEVFMEISNALREFPQYGLVLCGHSLGGGVAALLAILWSKPIPTGSDNSTNLLYLNRTIRPTTNESGTRASSRQNKKYNYTFLTSSFFDLVSDRPISCFNYGSPCVVNLELSLYSENLVTTVVNSEDIFSFLSVGSIVDLLSVTTTLSKERKIVEKIVKNAFSKQKNKLLSKLNYFTISLFDIDLSLEEGYNTDDSSISDAKSFNEQPSNLNTSLKNLNPNSSSSYTDLEPISSNSSTIEPVKGFLNSYIPFSQNLSSLYTNITTFSPASISVPPISDIHNRIKTWAFPKTPPDTPKRKESKILKEMKNSIKDLENWHLSIIKTLRANMDNEKLYPPGSVYVIDPEKSNQPISIKDPSGSDEIGSIFASNLGNNLSYFGSGFVHYIIPQFEKGIKSKMVLSKCLDVTKAFSELRFSKNMMLHHYPQVYEFNIGSLIHDFS
ncbi:Sn1-specific diacylglycerol lipase alpha [Smittium culicis]|uniref:sn-1-specific diacylglycerol lipase n=1 Tax=Smittium culicis TaxID=133412 RepID=A0A1R1Y0V7_9FUNG|nr:Sn1-specific diacylglycerol lipase alpha [Smittium culicis]